MKRIVIILGLLLPISLSAQVDRPWHNWTVNPSSFDFNMNLVVQVQQNGVLNPDLEIGAFNGMECRGIAVPHYENTLHDYLWYLTVYGTNNEIIDFYVRLKEEELEAKTDYYVLFQPNGIVGDPLHPQVINFVMEPTACPAYEIRREVRVNPMPVGKGQIVDVSFPYNDQELRGAVAEVYTLSGSMIQAKKLACVPVALDPLKMAGTYLLKITLGSGEVLMEKIIVI